jgi:exopolysaccharide production protein ExoQ
MRQPHKLAAYYFLAESLGAFGIISTLIYGRWTGGFAATTKLAIFLHLSSIATGLALLYRGRIDIKSINIGAIQAIALALLFMASSVWSIDPDLSLRRGLQYVFFIVGLIGVASNLTDDEYLEIIDSICLACAVISIALIFVAPDIAWMGGDEEETSDDIRYLAGLFTHKNFLGEIVAVGSLATAHCFRTKQTSRLRSLVKAAIYLITVLLARSGTSLMVIMFIYGCSFIVWMHRQGGGWRTIGRSMTIAAVPLVLVTVLFPDILLELLGKDPTLTGRTILWAIVVDKIGERPILGWGFFAFWGDQHPIAGVISGALGWTVPHAHNAILETSLEIGMVGAIFLVTMFLRNIALAWRCLKTPANELAISALMCFGSMIIIGFTETVILDSTTPFTGMFFVCGFMCERAINLHSRSANSATTTASGATARRAAGQADQQRGGLFAPDAPDRGGVARPQRQWRPKSPQMDQEPEQNLRYRPTIAPRLKLGPRK